jgi:hypothetical protein
VTDVAISSPVTEAALALLRSTTGAPIGDAIRPEAPAKPPASFYPYGVLYVGTTDLRGTLVAPKEDGLHRLQVSCVGRTRAGAESLRDQARETLLDVTAWDIDGYAVASTEHAGSPQIFRDDDVSPALFNAITVVNVLVTPDGSGS